MTNPTPAPERINLPNGCLLHKHGSNWHLSVPTGNFDGMIEEFDDKAAKAFALAMNAPTQEAILGKKLAEAAAGCSNHGCILRNNTGMATNGRCNCKANLAEALAEWYKLEGEQ